MKILSPLLALSTSLLRTTIIGVSVTLTSVSAQVPGTQGITSVFSTGAHEVAGYDATAKQLVFFTISGQTAQQVATVPVPGQVMGVLTVGDDHIITTGMGRGDLTPPIRVHTIAKSKRTAKNPSLELRYERPTERPQVTHLRLCGTTVWLGFFESKYNTVIGALTPPAAGVPGPWSFTQRVAVRMGDSFDCLGESLVVGRSYGDVQGQDGDLLLFEGSERTLLPSYRGVRGVQSIGDATEPMIVVGDGWHPNYGEMAQGRVSLLRKRKGETRFALELLDLDRKNFNFTKFREFTSGGARHLVALGSSQVVVYGDISAASIRKQVVYTQVGTSHVLDVVVGSVDGTGATLAIADEGLRLVRVGE